MQTQRPVSTRDFFATHPVFSLEEAEATLRPAGGRAAMVQRLKHHLRTGQLTHVSRGIYAVVPPLVEPDQFQPDPFLAGRAARPDGIFSYHSALELLGAAHSVWHQVTLFTDQRRPPLPLGGTRVLFLDHPRPLLAHGEPGLGVRRVEWRAQLLRATGPERTLVDGLRRPDLAGGLPELLESAAGFATLDLDLLETVLTAYATANLWAATGWFLEQHRQTFHVDDGYLDRLEAKRPRVPQYLVRSRRGGTLVPRWNLILPPELESMREPDER